MKLEGKRVLVFGAGISGIGAADLLCKVGACPVIYDGNDKQDPEAIRAKLEQPEKVEIILGELSEEARKTLNLVVMSPGVPTDLPIVDALRAQGLPIWGEVELAYQMGKGKVLAITGTNGRQRQRRCSERSWAIIWTASMWLEISELRILPWRWIPKRKP